MKEIFSTKVNIDSVSVQVKKRNFDSSKDISCAYRFAPKTFQIDEDTMGANLLVEAYAEGIIDATVTISGEFGMKRFAESREDLDTMKSLAMSMMFPYARTAIDQACGLVGLFPLHLPVLDAAEAFEPSTIPFLFEAGTPQAK